MEELRIKKHFSSIEHPQTNGQVEGNNWLLVIGLKKRLEEAMVDKQMNYHTFCRHIILPLNQ